MRMLYRVTELTTRTGTGTERKGRGSYPDGERDKHAGGHTAVAEGGGGAGPYLEASLNCHGSPD